MMRWRQLWKLLRQRIRWCELIHWLAWRVAVEALDSPATSREMRDAWRMVEAYLRAGNGKVLCECVEGELRRHLADGSLPKKVRWR